MASKSLKAFIAIAIVAALAFTAVPTVSDESDAATVSSATGTISFRITGSDAYLGDTSTMVSFTLVYSYTPYDKDNTPNLKVEYSAKAVDENGRIVDTMAGTETITGPVSNVTVDGPSAYARDVFSHSSGTATATATVTGAGELTGTVYMYVGSQVYDSQSISIKVGSRGSSGAAASESTTTDKDGNTTTTTSDTKESADGTRTTTSTSTTVDINKKEVSKTTSTETVKESDDSTVIDKTSVTTNADKTSVTEKTTTTTDKSTGKVTTESQTVSKDADGKETKVESTTTVEKNGSDTTTVTETTKTTDTEKIESSTTRVADSKGTTVRSETSTTTTNTETGETKTVTKNFDAERAVDDSKVESSAEVGDAKIETSAEHVFENGDVKSSEATTTVDNGASSEMDISSDLARTAIDQLRDALSGIGHDVRDRHIGFVSGTDSRLNAAMGSSYFGSIADAKASVSFRSGVMGVSFGADISKRFAGYEEKISLSLGFGAVGEISEAQRNAIGDRTFVDVKAYAGNSSVHELGGDATVSADYELPKGVDASHVKVWYIDDDGKAHGMETTWADGKVSFKTTHFSTFVIAEDDTYSEDEGGSTMVIVAVIACVVIVAAVVAVWYTKKN